jgi:hypothetical protein
MLASLRRLDYLERQTLQPTRKRAASAAQGFELLP